MSNYKTKIIIVGGLSAGPSAAAKARRENEDCEIILFEQTGYISYATCGIPYALSGKIAEREKLMVVSAELLSNRFNVEVKLNEPVIDIDTTAHTVTTPLGSYPYDKLIFATGATAYTPPVEGLEELDAWSHCKSIEHFDKIIADQVLAHKKRVAVLGAGLIGIEVAENLIEGGKAVTLIEMNEHVLPIWDAKFGHMAGQVLSNHGVAIKTGAYLQRVEPQPSGAFTMFLSNGEKIEADYLIVSVGIKPNTQLLLAEGAEHLRNGAIVVNEYMETSLPDVYAAGDCASIKNLITDKHDYFPMGTHSNKGGRAAGANAIGKNPQQMKGAYGTAIVKVFDHTLARTGMNSASLKMADLPFQSTFYVAPATPSFYPGAKDLFVEIFFDPDTKKLLGAEIIGEEGVDKRIDVLSTCLYAKLTLDDLPHLDLAYAPPYSPAKDAVISAGYIANNQLRQDFAVIQPQELAKLIRNNGHHERVIVDVRTAKEIEAQGMLPGAINRPLDQLRDYLPLLNPALETVVYCQKGLRGYVASMILANHGFSKVKNMSGGFLAWKKLAPQWSNPVNPEVIV